jgi:biopolymer transport protein ExbB/TolQ
VGGFSEFLTTNVSIDQVDQVTAELGEVASGLSFAFDTTLLGLLAGLVASVVSSGVQSREERLLTHIDEMGLRIMENSASVGARPVTPVQALGAEAEAFDRMMRARLEELSAQMGHFTRAVQTGLDGFLGEWSRLPPEVARVAADLNGLREHLATAAKSTDQLILETRVLLEGLNEASSGMSGRLATSIGSISQTVEGLGESLEGVSGTLAQRMTALSERLTASDGQLHSALSGLQDSVDRNLEGAAAATRSQNATEQALQRLADSLTDLGDRIAEVRDAQAALAPVLKQLSGPMELRLMPAGVMAATPRHDAR